MKRYHESQVALKSGTKIPLSKAVKSSGGQFFSVSVTTEYEMLDTLFK